MNSIHTDTDPNVITHLSSSESTTSQMTANVRIQKLKHETFNKVMPTLCEKCNRFSKFFSLFQISFYQEFLKRPKYTRPVQPKRGLELL